MSPYNAPAKFEVATSKGLEGIHLQENTLFDLNGLGGDAFTTKYNI